MIGRSIPTAFILIKIKQDKNSFMKKASILNSFYNESKHIKGNNQKVAALFRLDYRSFFFVHSFMLALRVIASDN